MVCAENLTSEKESDMLISSNSNTNGIYATVKCKTILAREDYYGSSTLVIFSLENKSSTNIHIDKFYLGNAHTTIDLKIAPQGSVDIGKHFSKDAKLNLNNALWRVSLCGNNV
jgi:hypothetical protein